MTDPSVTPAELRGNRSLLAEADEMVRTWMHQAPKEEITEFLFEHSDRFFDDGEPDDLWLDGAGEWNTAEVFTALWEGRSIDDSGNVDRYTDAIGRAEGHFGEDLRDWSGRL